MTFRFLHAADLHLDTPFQGIARISPELRDKLRNASLEVLERLVDEALRHDVRFVILAGDIYDGAERGLRAQLRVLAALERLSQAGIDTFIVYGNHDPVLEGWSAIRVWPERVHIFPHDRVGTRELQVGDRLVTISGISYPRREVTENLSLRFEVPTQPGFHIAVLHANVDGWADHPNYSPCSLDDLVRQGYDYWALGHIHGRRILRDANPVVAYSGSTQGRSFTETESGPKGAFVVTVEDERVTPKFVELGPVRLVEVVVSATGLADIGEVVEALIDAAEREQAEDREVLLRGRVVGPTAIYDDLIRAEATRDILDELTDRVRRNSRLWWANLVIEVRPERNLADIARREDLHGEIVRQGKSLAADIEGLRLRLRENRALAPWIDGLTDDELRAVTERATALAVSLAEH